MTALTVFNFQDFEVRTVAIDGEPWFVAKDVCDVLGLTNISESIKRLSEREFSSTEVTDASGRLQQMTIVRESGLYKLILKSRKAAAIAFQDWLTEEVLPSIRKTGSYSVQREPLTELDRMAGMMNQFLPALAGSITEIRAVVQQQTERLEAVEERQKEIDPQAIDAYRVELHAIKDALVAATKGKPQQVTFDGYWRELKRHCGVGSFALTNQAALTVPLMEKAHAYALSWCEARGVKIHSQLRLVPNERPAV